MIMGSVWEEKGVRILREEEERREESDQAEHCEYLEI